MSSDDPNTKDSPGDQERWLDDDLPETKWEIYSQRKHLPGDLQRTLGIPFRTLRVPKAVDTKIRTKHPEILHDYNKLREIFMHWQYVGRSPDKLDIWEVFLPKTTLHMLMIVIGRDKDGSHNLVSMFLVRKRRLEQ